MKKSDAVGRPSGDDPDTRLDAVFLALSDPTRRSILTLLRDDDATVGQLAHHFTISQPAVSRHLRMLERAGLISRRPVGTATINSLTADHLADAARFIHRFDEFWQHDDDTDGPLLDTFAGDDWMI